MAFWLLLLYLVLSYLRPVDLIPGFAEYRVPFLVGIAGLVVSMFRLFLRGFDFLVRSTQVYFLLAFLAVVTASPLLAQGWVGGAVEAFESCISNVIGCLLIIVNVDSIRRLRIVAATICVLSVILVAQSVTAYHTGMGGDLFVLAQNIGETERVILKRARALGYMNDPNDLAQALVAAMPLLWAAWSYRRGFRNFCLIALPTGALVYGVYLTRSRGAVLSILAVTLLFARLQIQRFRRTLPVVITICFAAILVAADFSGGREFSTEEGSAAGRIEAWGAGLDMLRANPLFGVGYARFVEHHVLTAHNSFVLCFAELGLIGFFLWIGMIFACLSDLTAIETAALETEGEESEDAVRWARAIRVSLYGFLIGAFFLSRTYVPTLYNLLAIGIATSRIGRQMDLPVSISNVRTIIYSGLITGGAVVLIYLIVRFGA